jgi:hypothetical protein
MRLYRDNIGGEDDYITAGLRTSAHADNRYTIVI